MAAPAWLIGLAWLALGGYTFWQGLKRPTSLWLHFGLACFITSIAAFVNLPLLLQFIIFAVVLILILFWLET